METVTFHAALSGTLALGALAFALLRRGGAPRTDWPWLGVIGIVLLAGRWPSIWYPWGLNPDESQFIAGALTLRANPVFWESVNGMTSGPLNYFALWPAGFLLGADTYLGARLTAWFLIAVALGAVHVTIARRFSPDAARLSGLPTLCFLAFTAQPDFTHYSSELLSMAMIAVAISLAVRSGWEGASSPFQDFATGLLLGAVPFAKPQATPLALFVGISLVGWIGLRGANSWKAPSRVFGGALVTATMTALLIWYHELGPYVITAFFRQNTAYVGSARLTWLHTAFQLFTHVEPYCPLFFTWIGTALVGLLVALVTFRRPIKGDQAFLAFAFILALVATVSVLTPRRAFYHYLMLLPVPWTLFFGALVGAQMRPGQVRSQWRKPALITVLAGSVAAFVAVRAAMPYPPRAQFSPYHSDFSGQIAAVLKEYAHAGDSLSVWGWRPDLFVLSQLPQGNRDAVSEGCISPGPFHAFARSYFIRDMEHTHPALFVDSVGPGSFFFDQRATQAHDTAFPELARLVERSYTLVTDVDGVRIYVRNDRAAPGKRP